MSHPATMRVGFDTPIDIELKYELSPHQRNLLIILGEFPNRFVNHNHLCERMGLESNALRIQVTRLRRCLTPNWTIEARPHRGYRLIDLRDK